MRATPGQQKSLRGEILVIVVLLLAASAFGVKLFLDNRADAEAAQNRPPAVVEKWQGHDGDRVGPLGDQARRVDGDPQAIGAVDAPVVMVEYSDYRCPFCGKFSRSTAPDLIDRYVDAGLLRIEWRDFPIFGEQSILAARAGRAAAAQGRFWEYNAALFAAAPPTGHAEMTPERLRGFAEQAGVPDLERFTADLGSEQFDAAISTDWSEAQSLGVTSTPSFAVHGHPIAGAQPTDTFTKLIDNLLAAR